MAGAGSLAGADSPLRRIGSRFDASPGSVVRATRFLGGSWHGSGANVNDVVVGAALERAAPASPARGRVAFMPGADASASLVSRSMSKATACGARAALGVG